MSQSRHEGKMKAEEGANEQLDYNQSHIQQFFIAGGELGLKHFYTELSVLLLAVYLLVLIGNSVVCIVVVLEAKLHTPMYTFICCLSLTDIVITTSVLPKMISVGLLNDIAISFTGCFVQLNTYLAFQSAESFLLGIMAYDRYVAICNPLRYHDIITLRTCVQLAACTVVTGILITFPTVLIASRLSFCGSHIMFWFCDFPPVVALACSDTTFLLFIALMGALIVIIFPFMVIVLTYMKIILSICKTKCLQGRKKAFSTCSSHLSVVILFYFAHFCIYISSTVKNVHPTVLILISIFNCLLTPFANPIIYSFRNKELKNAIQKHFHISKVLV